MSSKLSIYRKFGDKTKFKQAYQKTMYEWKVHYEYVAINTRFGTTNIITCGPETAPPLVLLHGFGFSSTMWIDNVEELSQQYKLYAVDFIGDMNKSVATKQIEDEIDCVEWFSDVLDGLGINKTNILGMSFGGYLALLFCIHLQERISKLVTICPGASLLPQRKLFFVRSIIPGIFPSEKRINKFMDWMCAPGNHVNNTLREQFILAMQNCMPRIKVFARYIADDQLQKIKIPTLLILGDYEVQYDPLRAIERAKQLIPDLTAVLIKNAGHGVSLEKPKETNKYVLEFLNV